MKYKYYFRKPRSEVTKDIFQWLLTGGAITVAATSPYFGIHAWRAFQKLQKQKKYEKQNFSDIFTRLRRKGFIEVKQQGYNLHIALTPEGRRRAGYLQINALKINRPKIWDEKWRLVMFDIAQPKRKHRNALRRKLEELGFALYQKSVWLHAFDCKDEIAILKNFFGLKDSEISLIVAQKIDREQYFKKRFKI
jgi:CRISPR-associated endonuclease Cas2